MGFGMDVLKVSAVCLRMYECVQTRYEFVCRDVSSRVCLECV